MTEKEYAKAMGLLCPACGAQEASTSAEYPDAPAAGDVRWKASCTACGATWRDVFTLARYENLEKP